MKKYILSLCTILYLLALCVFADISVTLNGELVDCEKYGQNPIIQDGRTLVPLRAIFEAIGAHVEWNQQQKSITSFKNDTTVYLEADNDIMIKNGQRIKIDVPARVENGRTLVPVRAVAEAFDVDVYWDNDTRTVELFDISSAEFSKGQITGDVYKNYYLGLVFKMPEGFRAFSEAQIKSMLGHMVDGGNELDMDKEADKYELVAFDQKGNNIQITAVKSGDAIEPETEAQNVYSLEIGKVPYRSIDYQTDDFRQTVATCKTNGYDVTIVFTYKTFAMRKQMTDAFDN